MQKISTAFVSAQVEPLKGKSTVGVCLNQATLSPNQIRRLEERLCQTFGGLANFINLRKFRNSTIIWIEIGVDLCRRSLRREMRRFGQVLEAVELVETAMICSPFPRLRLVH